MKNYKSMSTTERTQNKSVVLQNGVYSQFYNLHKELIISSKQYWKALENESYEEAERLFTAKYCAEKELRKFFYNEDGTRTLNLECCMHLYKSSCQRSYRLYKRVKGILRYGLEHGYNNLFLTLTFTNDVLNSTSEKTRRTYVSRWLKQNCIQYVANIDYGKKNEREHYHAVVTTEQFIDLTSWVGGACNCKQVHLTNEDIQGDLKASSQAMGKYISKLTNHALKETTQSKKIIYSRGLAEYDAEEQ